MKKSILVFLCTLILISMASALDISFTNPTEGAQFNGSYVEVTLDKSVDIYANATQVELFYKNTASATYLSLTTNTTTNLTHYTLYYDFTGESESKDAGLKAVVTNYSGELIEKEIIFNLNLLSPWHTALPNLTFQEDTISTSLDLDDYIKDDEARTITYSVSEPSNNKISISTENVLTVTPSANYSGIETMEITFTDGLHTNTTYPILLNVTAVNDAPYLLKDIEDINKTQGSTINIALNNYFTDIEGTKLNYTISEITSATIEIENEELIIKPNSDFTGSFTSTVTASDGVLTVSSREFKVILAAAATETQPVVTDTKENKEPTIGSTEPSETSITVQPGEKKKFSIEISDDDAVSVVWKVNDEEQTSSQTVDNGITRSSIEYEFTEEKTHSVIAKVSDGTNTLTTGWTVEVVKTETPGVCGNGFIESGENCNTCAEDAGCSEGESCINAVCIAQEKNSKWKDIVLILVIALVTIGLVIFSLWYYKRLKLNFERLDKEPVRSFKPKKSGILFTGKENPIADIDDFFRRKKEPHQEAQKEEEKSSRTGTAIARNYIHMAIKRGRSKKRISNDLQSKGWPSEQIEKILKEF